jgi:hypothetical protein
MVTKQGKATAWINHLVNIYCSMNGLVLATAAGKLDFLAENTWKN